MKKILSLTIFLMAFSYAGDVHLYLCDTGHTDDGSGNATFSLCYDSDVDIAGYQFDFDGGGSGFTVTGASGGQSGSLGFQTSIGGNNLVLAFTFTPSNPIPASNGNVLCILEGTYDTSGLATIKPAASLDNPAITAFSAADATEINLTQASSQWEAGVSSTLDADLPVQYALSANYPNPFNPSTTIDYNVENAGNVSIVVYDMMGREVKTLINDYVTPKLGGDYSVTWDGTNNSNAFVATGVYMYRMVANDFVKTSKMTLAK